MKPYKLKRRMDEQREKNPSKAKRKQILINTTKKIALDRFNDLRVGISHVYPSKDVDVFEIDFLIEIMDDFNLQYSEAQMMYPLYRRCMKALEEKEKKMEFLQKVYKPLEEDLFHII